MQLTNAGLIDHLITIEDALLSAVRGSSLSKDDKIIIQKRLNLLLQELRQIDEVQARIDEANGYMASRTAN